MKLSTPLVLALFWHSVSAAGDLISPRGIIFDSAGNLLAVQQGVGIVGFTLNTDGSAKSRKTVLSNTMLNHGIAFSADGKTIFASSSNTA
ncbi:Soluble quino protein glucose dehydrogenase [Mycena kentingensis (nom. inval.)]|nr:Soluble quino protein glucose dehydrogenase [Mycena kentingensis (nom. inval.)]